jgi:hypothetical protein
MIRLSTACAALAALSLAQAGWAATPPAPVDGKCPAGWTYKADNNAPRDPQTGLPTGKRMYEPMTASSGKSGQPGTTARDGNKSASDSWSTKAATAAPPKGGSCVQAKR